MKYNKDSTPVLLIEHKCNVLHMYVTQIMLQGSTLPPTQCDTATIDFFTTNIQCSRTVANLFHGNESAVANLYDGNCPMQFNDYATACIDAYGDEVHK